MVHIYILKLKQNKYFVGKTDNLNFTLNDFDKSKLSWTLKYEPIELYNFMPHCDEFDEDKFTLKYMALLGIDNVRGGTFKQLNITEDEVNVIIKMIINSNHSYDHDRQSMCISFNDIANIPYMYAETWYKYIKQNKSNTKELLCEKCRIFCHLSKDCMVETNDISELNGIMAQLDVNKRHKWYYTSFLGQIEYDCDNRLKESENNINILEQRIEEIKSKYMLVTEHTIL